MGLHTRGVCAVRMVCAACPWALYCVYTQTHTAHAVHVRYMRAVRVCVGVCRYTHVCCVDAVFCVCGGALCTICGVCVCIYVCMPMYLYCTRNSLYTYIPSPCCTHSEHNCIYHTHTHTCTHTVQKVYSVCWVWYSVCVCGSVYYAYCVFMLCELRVQHFALHHCPQGILQGFLPTNVPNSPSSALPKRRERLC